MLGLLFTILKIVGLILLIVLALIIVILLCVLFVPVRYALEGSNGEDFGPKFSAKVSYLLHFIAFEISYENELNYVFRLLGIKLFSSADEHKEKKKPKKKKSNEPDLTTADEKAIDDKTIDDRTIEPSVEGTEASKEDKKTSGKKLKHKSERGKKPAGEKKPKKEKKDSLLGKLKNKDTKYVIHFLIEQSFYILNKLKPKRCEADIRFGLTDPAYTGWITGGLAVTPWIYKKRVKVIPDFKTDENFIHGYVKMSGHIAVITFVIVGIKALLDKTVRTFIFGLLK